MNILTIVLIIGFFSITIFIVYNQFHKRSTTSKEGELNNTCSASLQEAVDNYKKVLVQNAIIAKEKEEALQLYNDSVQEINTLTAYKQNSEIEIAELKKLKNTVDVLLEEEEEALKLCKAARNTVESLLEAEKKSHNWCDAERRTVDNLLEEEKKALEVCKAERTNVDNLLEAEAKELEVCKTDHRTLQTNYDDLQAIYIKADESLQVCATEKETALQSNVDLTTNLAKCKSDLQPIREVRIAHEETKGQLAYANRSLARMTDAYNTCDTNSKLALNLYQSNLERLTALNNTANGKLSECEASKVTQRNEDEERCLIKLTKLKVEAESALSRCQRAHAYISIPDQFSQLRYSINYKLWSMPDVLVRDSTVIPDIVTQNADKINWVSFKYENIQFEYDVELRPYIYLEKNYIFYMVTNSLDNLDLFETELILNRNEGRKVFVYDPYVWYHFKIKRHR